MFRVAISCFIFAATTAFAEGNADAGKQFFEIQCAACHTAAPNDNGGNQGPSLIGVLGRPAASDKEFDYTKQLKESKLVWDAATLERFLSGPDTMVPGTAMVVVVPNQSDRDNLIAYFKSVAAPKSAAARQTHSTMTLAAALETPAPHAASRTP